MQEKKIIHLIYGAALFWYFKNAINSVILKDNSSDIIICINNGPKNQIKKILDFTKLIRRNYFFKRKLIIKTFTQNKTNPLCKVGNLYKSYNYALNYCYKNNYEILHILQNDMQLMEWNNKILNLATELFAKNKSTIHIQTGFVRCVTPEPLIFKKKMFLSSINKNHQVSFLENYGITDWGLYDLKKLKKVNFKFKTTEGQLGLALVQKKIHTIVFPLPFVGVIPWPATYRHDTILGFQIKSKNKLILKNKYSNNFLQMLKKLNNNLFFQEDWIDPNGWRCLYPPLYTDFSYITYWINLKLNQKRISIHYFNGFKRSFLINFLNPFNTKANIFDFTIFWILNKFRGKILKYKRKSFGMK